MNLIGQMKFFPNNSPKKLYLSILIPVFNEENNIALLAEKINDFLKVQTYDYEVVWVNNGSTDQTDEELQKVFQKYATYTQVLKVKHPGKSVALQVGIDHAQGDLIGAVDGDLQNDPKDFENMLQEIEKGYDLCTGWRQKRNDSFFKRLSSKGANFIRRILTNEKIHDVGCGLWVARREIFKNICLRRGFNRFLSAFAIKEGYKVTEVKVSHSTRYQGYSKYAFWDRLKEGSVDLFLFWIKAYRKQIPRKKLYQVEERIKL